VDSVSIIALILLLKNKRAEKTRILLYIISIVLGGIILGGIHSAIIPIQQIIMVLDAGSRFSMKVKMNLIIWESY